MNRNDEINASPERRCILSRQSAERAGLIRLVADAEGMVWPDPRARVPGRGAWVRPDRALVEQAATKGRLKPALTRALHVAAPKGLDDLPDRIEAALARTVLENLGLALRAGHLILGHDRICGEINAGHVRLLIHSADASPDGRARLDKKLNHGEAQGMSMVVPANREILSVALGRGNAVHLALVNETVAARVARLVAQWRGFMSKTNDETRQDEETMRRDEKKTYARRRTGAATTEGSVEE